MTKAIYLEVKEGSTSSGAPVQLVKFTMPTPSPVRLTELSLLPDSGFQSNGYFQIVVAGQTQVTTLQRLRNSLSIDLSKFNAPTVLPDGRIVNGLVLLPNDTVEINAYSGSGTVTLSCFLIGEVV